MKMKMKGEHSTPGGFLHSVFCFQHQSVSHNYSDSNAHRDCWIRIHSFIHYQKKMPPAPSSSSTSLLMLQTKTMARQSTGNNNTHACCLFRTCPCTPARWIPGASACASPATAARRSPRRPAASSRVGGPIAAGTTAGATKVRATIEQ